MVAVLCSVRLNRTDREVICANHEQNGKRTNCIRKLDGPCARVSNDGGNIWANERNKLSEASTIGHANQIDTIRIETESFAKMVQELIEEANVGIAIEILRVDVDCCPHMVACHGIYQNESFFRRQTIP